jgi:hypothetical protein
MRCPFVREQIAYVTYSLSLFVIRTSGSLPMRPMRMSLDKSDERDGVVENACDECEDVGRDDRGGIYARERGHARDGLDGGLLRTWTRCS